MFPSAGGLMSSTIPIIYNLSNNEECGYLHLKDAMYGILLLTDNGLEVGFLAMVNGRKLELKRTQYVLDDHLHSRF